MIISLSLSLFFSQINAPRRLVNLTIRMNKAESRISQTTKACLFPTRVRYNYHEQTTHRSDDEFQHSPRYLVDISVRRETDPSGEGEGEEERHQRRRATKSLFVRARKERRRLRRRIARALLIDGSLAIFTSSLASSFTGQKPSLPLSLFPSHLFPSRLHPSTPRGPLRTRPPPLSSLFPFARAPSAKERSFEGRARRT